MDDERVSDLLFEAHRPEQDGSRVYETSDPLRGEQGHRFRDPGDAARRESL